MAETPAIQRVAAVLFDGFTVLDMYGPVQAFGSCRRPQPDGTVRQFFEVFTVADRKGPIQGAQGPSTLADFSFGDAPHFDILLVPGGPGTRDEVKHAAFLDRLRAASEKASVTATVCTGSALLARTGLMDGRPATSNKIAWDWVVQQGPRVLWKRKARWVDDGSLITSSGVSAGTDMALALIARLHGRDMAVTTARNMEYLWHEKAEDDPFA
jgi:transcriptional regulator GlxA family with amidase domain